MLFLNLNWHIGYKTWFSLGKENFNVFSCCDGIRSNANIIIFILSYGNCTFRFWYVSMVACAQNKKTCKWEHVHNMNMTLSYDLTLVNGNPESVHHRHYFEYHFSYDTQVRLNKQRWHLKSVVYFQYALAIKPYFIFLGFAKSISTFTRLVYYTYPSSIFRGCETKTPDSKASYSSITFGICGHSADIISLWLICTKWCRNQSIQYSWWCYGDFCTGTILSIIQSFE